ncbi:hypothetical protein [Treponema sp. R6D11]
MAKYQRRKTAQNNNPSFEWDVLCYETTKKTYKIKNKATGEIRSLSRAEYIDLVNRQGKNDWK